MSDQVLALDLERTLISDALTAEPRPGLHEFLEFCTERFARVVLFTTVEQETAWDVLSELSHRGFVPGLFFNRLEYVEWCGEYKDLVFVKSTTPDRVLLVDDDPGWIRPDQHAQWVSISAWDGGQDNELVRIRSLLERRLDPQGANG